MRALHGKQGPYLTWLRFSYFATCQIQAALVLTVCVIVICKILISMNLGGELFPMVISLVCYVQPFSEMYDDSAQLTLHNVCERSWATC